MSHNRKLVLGAVDLVGAKVRNAIPAMGEARNEVESILTSSSWLDKAPFHWVGLVIRYGCKNDKAPEFSEINETHRDLPIAIEVDINDIYEVHKNKEALKTYFKIITLNCLLAVAEKYSLPIGVLKKELELINTT